jgi:hypothetical protein
VRDRFRFVLAGMCVAFLLGALAGCRSKTQGPSIDMGKAQCETCGMTVNDARFAVLAEDGSAQHVYDSIECFLKGRRESGETSAEGVWIMDFETQTLHPGAAVTIVKGDFPSPMGGGYAAFADASQAHAQAEAHGGQLGTLTQALSGNLGGRP